MKINYVQYDFCTIRIEMNCRAQISDITYVVLQITSTIKESSQFCIE